MVTTRLSIDFGTTNTAAALRDADGSVHEVRLSSVANLMPSAVFADSGTLVVGTAAVNLAFTDPTAFEANPKRRLGENTITLGGSIVSGTDLAAAVIGHVITTARRVSGEDFDEVLLTHPDSWAENMQSLLREAAEQAGVPGPRIALLTESHAAANYYSTRADLTPAPRICVFDFGAGTCDVAVIDRQPDGQFTVRASAGLDHLGGNDIDGLLFGWVQRQLAERATPVDIKSPLMFLNVRERIREAKETLSSASRAHIALGGNDVLQIHRAEFETLIHVDVERCVTLARQVITAANARNPMPTPPTIYLVGGSSNIPLVHDRLSHLGTVATLGHLKFVVVVGALAAEQPQRDAVAPRQVPRPYDLSAPPEQLQPSVQRSEPLTADPASTTTQRPPMTMRIASAILRRPCERLLPFAEHSRRTRKTQIIFTSAHFSAGLLILLVSILWSYDLAKSAESDATYAYVNYFCYVVFLILVIFRSINFAAARVAQAFAVATVVSYGILAVFPILTGLLGGFATSVPYALFAATWWHTAAHRVRPLGLILAVFIITGVGIVTSDLYYWLLGPSSGAIRAGLIFLAFRVMYVVFGALTLWIYELMRNSVGRRLMLKKLFRAN